MVDAAPDEQTEEPPVQYVTGCIGTGESLYDKLTALMGEDGTSWTKLAKSMAVSRQALIKSIRADKVAYHQLARVCVAIDVDPFSLIKTMAPETNRDIP